MLRSIVILTSAFALSAFSDSAFAQSQSLFGSNGPISQSNSGRSSRSTTGTSGLTGRNTGTQGLGGQGGLGQQSTGAGQFTGPQFDAMGSLSNSATGTGTGFVGQTNQAFVGNRLAGQAGVAAPGPTFTAPSGGEFDPESFRQQQGGGQSSTRQIRPRYRVSFDFERAPAAEIANRVETQLTRLQSSNPALAGIDIQIDANGVAVVRGQAPDVDTSRLIENIVRLEPGVRGVDNQLDVAGSRE